MSPAQGRGGIFISYRREETAAHAGRLFDRLGDHFGEDRVFMDVDSIAIGLDFTKALQGAVSECEVLLVLIGRDWLDMTDSGGRRRIDNRDDWVRVEIETALQRDIRVVPVLVDGALLPQGDDLPASLRPLIRRQALELTHTGFRSEVSRLVAAIDEVFGVRPDRSAEAPKRDRTAEAPKATPRPSAIKQGRWTLELLTNKGAKTTFRLSSVQEVHTIAVYMGWPSSLAVDGERIGPGGWEGGLRSGVEYSASTLSSRLESEVTFKVIQGTRATLRLRSLIVKIGDHVLTYESGIR